MTIDNDALAYALRRVYGRMVCVKQSIEIIEAYEQAKKPCKIFSECCHEELLDGEMLCRKCGHSARACRHAPTNTALVQKLVDALNNSEQLLQDAQDIMRSNIIHNGISNKDAIAAYIALLDNVRQRRVQTQTHQTLTEAEAWLEERKQCV